jgi:excisionase family DNA binding protein
MAIQQLEPRNREERRHTVPLLHPVGRAAERLAISPATVYRLIKAGELTPTRIGGRTLIAESELLGFVARNTELAH